MGQSSGRLPFGFRRRDVQCGKESRDRDDVAFANSESLDWILAALNELVTDRSANSKHAVRGLKIGPDAQLPHCIRCPVGVRHFSKAFPELVHASQIGEPTQTVLRNLDEHNPLRDDIPTMGNEEGISHDIARRFVNRVKAERKQRGWSQADLADRLVSAGLRAHPTTIAKIEAMDRTIRLDEAVVLASAFDLTLDEMIASRSYDQRAALDAFISLASRSADDVNIVADQIWDATERLNAEPADLVKRSYDSNDVEMSLDVVRSHLATKPAIKAVSSLVEARNQLREAVSAASERDSEVEKIVGGVTPDAVRTFLEAFLPPDHFKKE